MPKLLTSAMAPVQPTVTVRGVALLRPWVLEDAAAVANTFSNEAIQRWHIKRADSIGEARDWIAHWQSGWPRETECSWAIVDTTNADLLGRIALRGLELDDATADLGHGMTPGSRGRGLCTRGMIALSQWAFRDSTATWRSAEWPPRPGFAVEDVRRGAALQSDGRNDMHVHARLSSDAAIPET